MTRSRCNQCEVLFTEMTSWLSDLHFLYKYIIEEATYLSLLRSVCAVHFCRVVACYAYTIFDSATTGVFAPAGKRPRM